MYDADYIREQMKMLRTAKKLTQQFVAERMGVSKAFYNMLENGRKNINKEHIRKFAKAAEVPVSSILSDDEDMAGFSDYLDLTEMDKKLLDIIVQLTPEEKETIYQALKAGNYPSEILIGHRVIKDSVDTDDSL